MRIQETTAWLTLANLLTLGRLLLTPFVVQALMQGNIGTAWFLFALAAATDVCDGFVARACGAQSHVGRLLDPLADKVLLVGTVVGCTMGLPSAVLALLLPRWLVALLLVREVGMVVGALWLRWQKPDFMLAPCWAGKLATFFQLVLLGLLLSSAMSNTIASLVAYMPFLSGVVGCLTLLATAVYAWRVVHYFNHMRQK